MFLFLHNPIEKLLAFYELHDKVEVLVVIVCLIVLHDVWMVEIVQDLDLCLDQFEFVHQLMLIEDFNCDFEIFVFFVHRLIYFAKSSSTNNLSILSDLIILS